MGQLELELEFVVLHQPLARAPEPPAEFDLDGVLALAQHGNIEHQDLDHQPPEHVHLDDLARRLWLLQPRLLVVRKLMVNAALKPLRHLQSNA